MKRLKWCQLLKNGNEKEECSAFSLEQRDNHREPLDTLVAF